MWIFHPDSQKYLGFQWGERCYVFTVLPFGLATACYVITKLLRPVVDFIRRRGFKIVIYIDDGILIAKSFEQAKHLSRLIVDVLTKAAFVINIEKSKLEPTNKLKWLGFMIDLNRGYIYISQKIKIEKTRLLLETLLSTEYQSARLIASVIGRTISFSLAIGNIEPEHCIAFFKHVKTGVGSLY